MRIRAMLLSALLVSLAMTGYAQENEQVKSPTFRVGVRPILMEEDVVVVQFSIHSKTGGFIHWKGRRPKSGGGFTKMAQETKSNKPNARLTVLVDQVDKGDQAPIRKFSVHLSVGSGGLRTITTGDAESERLVRDDFELLLDPGEYPFDKVVEAFRYNNNTYSIYVTTKPKPSQ